jgi:hypothetical protein
MKAVSLTSLMRHACENWFYAQSNVYKKTMEPQVIQSYQ